MCFLKICNPPPFSFAFRRANSFSYRRTTWLVYLSRTLCSWSMVNTNLCRTGVTWLVYSSDVCSPLRSLISRLNAEDEGKVCSSTDRAWEDRAVIVPESGPEGSPVTSLSGSVIVLLVTGNFLRLWHTAKFFLVSEDLDLGHVFFFTQFIYSLFPPTKL